MECIFCKIFAGEIPSEIIYKDDDMLIFKDIEPKAPVHFLAIPGKHIESLDKLTESDTEVLGKLFLKMRDIAADIPELENGYRIVQNNGKEAGQTVFHMHFHLFGGRRMMWPPG
ncbi:MAG: histidine triad nucleotide-binding protein [bacterium]|nr:histidine triad nucleotide-binding protein [bacterium]